MVRQGGRVDDVKRGRREAACAHLKCVPGPKRHLQKFSALCGNNLSGVRVCCQTSSWCYQETLGIPRTNWVNKDEEERCDCHDLGASIHLRFGNQVCLGRKGLPSPEWCA
jgi:hypothetical protein